jgi:hypothetical protein
MARVEAARERRFRWGSHDCCTFAADCIEAVTGASLGEDVRGRYGTEAEATRLLGEGGLAALATRHLGTPLASPSLARRGDVALIRIRTWECLGIVLGPRVAAVGLAGLVFLPERAIETAWPVGWGNP